MLSFNVSKQEAKLISKIAQRAITERLVPDYGTIEMDVTTCHASGNPMNLFQLLESAPSDFAHDICGIHRHIERRTGKLTDCFVPRCSI